MSQVKTCNLSESELLKLYSALDADKNGILDENELKVLVKKIGMPEEYAKLCILIVGNGKKEIDFKKFQDFLAILLLYKNDKPKFLDLVFHGLDHDNSGTLEIDEVFVFLKILNIACTPQQAAKILNSADENSDRKLNKKEFARLVEGIEETLKEE